MRSWDQLCAEVTSCTRCRLAQGRTRVVFGVGDPHARLLFVGEAPGFHEDRRGEPFVGRAGHLLDELCAEVGLSRRDGVYITNVLRCRPPGNRDPQPDEVAACKPYLIEQLALIDPGVVVTLGAFATRVLLGEVVGGPPDPWSVPVSRVAGYRFHLPGRGGAPGRTLIPTFHPAAALRGNVTAMASLRRDLRLAADVLAGRLPTAAEALGLTGGGARDAAGKVGGARDPARQAGGARDAARQVGGARDAARKSGGAWDDTGEPGDGATAGARTRAGADDAVAANQLRLL